MLTLLAFLSGLSLHADIFCRTDGSIATAAANAGWVETARAELDACTKRNPRFEVENVDGDALSRFLALRDQVEACTRDLGEAPWTERLTLDYPAHGPNRALRSNRYSTAKIRKLIALALAGDVDPQLAIALALLENPPLADESALQGYEYGFGDLPLDAFPLFDALGCLSRGRTRLVTKSEWREARLLRERSDRIAQDLAAIKGFQAYRAELRARPDYLKLDGTTLADELATRPCAGVPCQGLSIERDLHAAEKAYEDFVATRPWPKQAEIRARLEKNRTAFVTPSIRSREVNLPWTARPGFLCARTGPLDPGVPAWFAVKGSADPDMCCVRVNATSRNPSKELRNALALDLIRTRIRPRPGPIASLAHDVQAFNGRGRLGVTESVDNRCFSGLNMATHPFYGARVLDLMLNTLMANPRVQELIAQASTEFDRPVKSVFCAKLGAGRHELNRSTFLDLQKSYLLGGESWRQAACEARFR